MACRISVTALSSHPDPFFSLEVVKHSITKMKSFNLTDKDRDRNIKGRQREGERDRQRENNLPLIRHQSAVRRRSLRCTSSLSPLTLPGKTVPHGTPHHDLQAITVHKTNVSLQGRGKGEASEGIHFLKQTKTNTQTPYTHNPPTAAKPAPTNLQERLIKVNEVEQCLGGNCQHRHLAAPVILAIANNHKHQCQPPPATVASALPHSTSSHTLGVKPALSPHERKGIYCIYTSLWMRLGVRSAQTHLLLGKKAKAA